MNIKELIGKSNNINLSRIKRTIQDVDKLEVNSFKGNKPMILDTYKKRLEIKINLSEQPELQESIRRFIDDLEKTDVAELTCHLVNVNNETCMLITDKANERIIAALDWIDKINE